MKKIKNKLIEWLGGITVEEHENWLEYRYLIGKTIAYGDILEEMRCLYGTSAEKWCECIYTYIENTYGHYEDLLKTKKKKIRQ